MCALVLMRVYWGVVPFCLFNKGLRMTSRHEKRPQCVQTAAQRRYGGVCCDSSGSVWRR